MIRKNRVAEILGGIVFLTGLAVIFGWVYGIAVLKSILPIWATMKFSTAVCFLINGMALYTIAVTYGQEKKLTAARVVLPCTTFGTLFLMVTLLISSFTNTQTGLENLFVQEKQGLIMTTVPGRPSIGTMINFILMAAASYGVMINMDGAAKLRPVLRTIGGIIIGIGGIAMMGYIFHLPVLYYAVDNVSNAMAVHTAILFVLLGAGLISLKDGENILSV